MLELVSDSILFELKQPTHAFCDCEMRTLSSIEQSHSILIQNNHNRSVARVLLMKKHS